MMKDVILAKAKLMSLMYPAFERNSTPSTFNISCSTYLFDVINAYIYRKVPTRSYFKNRTELNILDNCFHVDIDFFQTLNMIMMFR